MKLLGLCLALCATSIFPSAAAKVDQVVTQQAADNASAAVVSSAASNQVMRKHEFRVTIMKGVGYSGKLIKVTNEATQAWVMKRVKFKNLLENQETTMQAIVGSIDVGLESSHNPPSADLICRLWQIEESLLAAQVRQLIEKYKKKGVLLPIEHLSRGSVGKLEYISPQPLGTPIDNKPSTADQKSKQ